MLDKLLKLAGFILLVLFSVAIVLRLYTDYVLQ